MSGGRARARVVVSGVVQGVGFRYTCQAAAQRRGLGGWVRNLQDGRVEALFEGPKGDVEALVEWCRRGPEGASVTDVAVEWQEPPAEGAGESGFRIAR